MLSVKDKIKTISSLTGIVGMEARRTSVDSVSTLVGKIISRVHIAIYIDLWFNNSFSKIDQYGDS